MFNTFNEFEHEVLEAIAAKFPRIYITGPLLLLARHLPDGPSKINSSIWKEDTNCIEWLNKREPNSVVYVNYGSMTVMSEQHLKEFAWGLANLKEMMEGDEGKKMREKALDWKKKAEAATDVGGSSYTDFDRFVKEALYHD
ncbi:hypothetical protein REPUB_Repub10bG0105900 [Reevesia pubescens]